VLFERRLPTVRRRGGNADIGPALPTLLRRAGIDQVTLCVSQPAALTGEVKYLIPLTLERTRQSVLDEELAAPAELAQLDAKLRDYCDDATTVVTLPRVIQVWGRKRTNGHGER
jgi:hypothetical protein